MLQSGNGLEEFLFVVGERDIVTGCNHLGDKFRIDDSLDIQGFS
jgi:hypothetical protein